MVDPGLLAYFQRAFRYDAWATGTALAACVAAGAALPEAALKRMAHIAAAHQLWQARLKGEVSPVPVWPDWSLHEVALQLEKAAFGWSAWLETLPDSGLEAAVGYTNSKGEFHTSRAEDVLTHVLLHAAYHRGQVAADLRAAGAEPAYTDFIHAARTGQV